MPRTAAAPSPARCQTGPTPATRTRTRSSISFNTTPSLQTNRFRFFSIDFTRWLRAWIGALCLRRGARRCAHPGRGAKQVGDSGCFLCGGSSRTGPPILPFPINAALIGTYVNSVLDLA